MTELIEVHVTYHEEALAQAAARALVEARLAACVHVSGPVQSTFWWNGAIQEGPEWVLAAKTRAHLFTVVAEAVAKDHPYELPGIVGTPLTATPAFAAWVTHETAAAGKD